MKGRKKDNKKNKGKERRKTRKGKRGKKEKKRGGENKCHRMKMERLKNQ